MATKSDLVRSSGCFAGGSDEREVLEAIADNLKKAGWSLGSVSAIDSSGRTIWIVDAHRDDGERFVVHADEILTAFVELEAVIPSRPFSF
jgi:hypothetical protein